MKRLPVEIIIVPRPAGLGFDHTLAALARLGAKIRRQQRRKPGHVSDRDS